MKKLGYACCLVSLAAFGGACSDRVNEYPVPREVRLTDSRAAELASAIEQYEACRLASDQRKLFFVQQRFRLFSENNANAAADTALFYVGRIYYDVGDDHNARITFLRHKRDFPRSSFRDEISGFEADMDARLDRYRAWLEESRGSGSSTAP